MNNICLLKYEIRKLILNKKFFYMILILCVQTLDMLMRVLVRGTYNTAPFSQWTFSDFISHTNPMLLVILILMCTTVFSEKEKSARKIIFSTPISQSKYYILKASSIGIVMLITTLFPIIISFMYYGITFGYHGYGSFIKPLILFFFPTIIFMLGFSMVLGKINVKILYGLLPFVFLGCSLNLSIPVWGDICGNNFLYIYQFISGFYGSKGPITYTFPNDFIFSRVIFVIFGITLFIFVCRKKEMK